MTAVVKTHKKVIRDDNLISMFNDMIGGEGDPEIIKRKHGEFIAAIKELRSCLNQFATGPFARKFGEYKAWMDETEKFVADIAVLEDEKMKYSELKDHMQTKRVILTGIELAKHKQFLTDTLSGSWILSYPGTEYILFAFTKFDVKHVWANRNTTNSVKEYCLNVFSIILKESAKIFKLIRTPDIDPKRFSSTVLGAIDKARKIPQLNRCKRAFDKIKNSVSMLENNFDEYYKNMLDSKNPDSIITDFITDVSNAEGNSPTILHEFRTIVEYYKEEQRKRKGTNTDPRLEKMLNSLSGHTTAEAPAAKIPDSIYTSAGAAGSAAPATTPATKVETKTESKVETKTEAEVQSDFDDGSYEVV